MTEDSSKTDAATQRAPQAEQPPVSPTDETFALSKSPTSSPSDSRPASPAASDDLATIGQPLPVEVFADLKSDSAPLGNLCCGRYELRAKIGGGSYGVVYRGWDPQLRREVAIKIARREKLRSDEDIGRFLDEARRMAGIDHPGVVPVYDFGQNKDGACFIVSKLIVGADLREVMERRRFSHTEAASLAADVADALQEVHRQGVVHRDVTPANILLDEKGRPLVSDFGLSLSPDAFGAGPQLCGTASYMSPEQAAGRADKLDARSDIYSLGVILFELVAGKRPYRSASSEQLLREIADERVAVPPPRQFDESIPDGLEKIILKALEKKPPPDTRRLAISRPTCAPGSVSKPNRCLPAM